MFGKASLAIILLGISPVGAHRQGSTSLGMPPVNTGRDPSTQTSPKPNSLREPQRTLEVETALGNGLKLVSRNITLEDELRRYKIYVNYPQIEGVTTSASLQLNRRIKDLVTKQYAWPLIRPTKDELRYYAKWPGVYNSVDLDYQVVLANENVLSIYFEAYSYGIGAAHSVEQSFTINFDMKYGRLLTLASLFKPGTRYLQVISDYCIEELSKDHQWAISDPLFRKELAPKVENYQAGTSLKPEFALISMPVRLMVARPARLR